MKSRHGKTHPSEDQAAANQHTQGKMAKPAVQAQTHAKDTAQLQNTSRRAVPAINTFTDPKRASDHPDQAEALDTPKGPGYTNPLQAQLKPIAQLLGSKGKDAGLSKAAKRCGFDPGDEELIKCWDNAKSLGDFESATASAEAFDEYLAARDGKTVAPPPAPAVFVAPDEAAQRARFLVEAAQVNWKAGTPLAAGNFLGREIRDALPQVVTLLKHDFHQANGTNTMAIRREKNDALAELQTLFDTVSARLVHEEAEAARDAGVAAGKQALLARGDVQGNAIVLHVVTNLQRTGNMVTAVVPGEYTGAEISAAIALWVSLIPHLPAVITGLNVPGGHTVIKRKLRAAAGVGQVFDYNKNLICTVDNNINNFHVNANGALRALMDAAGNNDVAL